MLPQIVMEKAARPDAASAGVIIGIGAKWNLRNPPWREVRITFWPKWWEAGRA
jgi:hypothetical protein